MAELKREAVRAQSGLRRRGVNRLAAISTTTVTTAPWDPRAAALPRTWRSDRDRRDSTAGNGAARW
ncbi:MAG: hypothetical protein EPN53_17180 [Acidobacteria bacterium]|nr:MAG: hypothetical protein EPN53_17180 [Acidobacteriota bacterium]